MKKILAKLTFLALLLLLLSGGYGLLLREWVDPRPWDNLIQRVELDEQSFPKRATPTTQSHLPHRFTQAESFDLLLTGRFVAGEINSAYGLWAGTTAVDKPLIVWVTPTGYAGVTHGESWLVPLAPWPHVRPEQDNEIWLRRTVVEEGQELVTLRLNRELFWVGEVAGLTGEGGTAVDIWGEGPELRIQFQHIQRSE